MMYSPADIADALATGLQQAAHARDAEQSPFGIDVLDELGLHPLLASGLKLQGWGVFTEERYPSGRARRQKTHGERCDLVVTADGRALRAPEEPENLFESPCAVDLGDALWIEVKSARAFHADGANPRYAAELLGAPSEDVVRLSTAPGVRHAMLALVLFARAESDGREHLAEWERTMHAEGLPVDTPRIRSLAIADRIGHAACLIAVSSIGRIQHAD